MRIRLGESLGGTVSVGSGRIAEHLASMPGCRPSSLRGGGNGRTHGGLVDVDGVGLGVLVGDGVAGRLVADEGALLRFSRQRAARLLPAAARVDGVMGEGAGGGTAWRGTRGWASPDGEGSPWRRAWQRARQLTSSTGW